MISQFLSTSRYEQILRLLDEERRVILEGPIITLGAIVDKREKLMTELLESDEKLPEAFITTIKNKAERNGKLILACLEGIRSGQSQIETLEETAGKLHTYAADGSKVEVTASVTTRDKKA